MNRFVRAAMVGGSMMALALGVAVFAGCQDEMAPTMELAGVEAVAQTGDELPVDEASDVGLEKMDSLLRLMLHRDITPDNVKRAVPGKLTRARLDARQGRQVVTVDVFIRADRSAIPALEAQGAVIRTVTDTGIMTASVPLDKLRGIASRSDVYRIEAGRSVHLSNDLSNALTVTQSGTYAGMNNLRSTTGNGVIVGVIDTGIDWTHGDFILNSTECPGCQKQSRVLYLWDQTDASDDLPPTSVGFTYGHEYTNANFNAALNDFAGADNDPTSPTWVAATDPTYPIKATAGDWDGHGTHVAGSAAGDGSATGLVGAAPDAEIIFVKFDFDDAAGRNTDTNIIDGINYIFKRAAVLGRPAVINMSLGSDFGPHDGTSLEERSLDDLAGPGKIVVVAAGNPGANNWSQQLRWGYAMHGTGALNTETFTLRFPTYTPSATDNYAFFDLWYKTGNKCRVKVTTPSGKTYPPSTLQYKNTWVTGSSYTGFNTTEGAILVGNGGDQLGWNTTTPDHEVYIEISDYYGTVPAAGEWTFSLVKVDTKSVCSGTFHAWYGVSDNIVKGWRDEKAANPNVLSTPRFGGRPSDNAVTIGTPASANEAIAVAAYMTRDAWDYAYGVQPEGACVEDPGLQQTYDALPIGYYDNFAVGELAYFSGRGPRRDNVLKPEIATPGVGIASSMSHFVLHEEWANRCVSYWNGGPYHFGTNRVFPGLQATVIQGTSMACPNATGAIATLLEKKGDLNDKCLRQIFQAAARHDSATDQVQFAANSAFTDTDGTVGSTKPINNDWGYGKMDIAAALAYMDAHFYTSCAGSCVIDADCGTGYKCTATADPCACNTCVAVPACYAAGTVCTLNSQCCSNLCSGKKVKTCK